MPFLRVIFCHPTTYDPTSRKPSRPSDQPVPDGYGHGEPTDHRVIPTSMIKRGELDLVTSQRVGIGSSIDHSDSRAKGGKGVIVIQWDGDVDPEIPRWKGTVGDVVWSIQFG